MSREGAPLDRPLRRHGRFLAPVLTVFLVHGLLHLLLLEPFKPLDEPRHAAYALILYDEARIPSVLDPLPKERMGVGRIRGSNTVAAANHPPLYYLLVGLPLKLAADAGNLDPGVRVARLMTLVMGAVGMGYAYLALCWLTPRRPELSMAAATFVALVPAWANVSALIHNDALAFMTGAAAFEAALRTLNLGPSRRRLFEVGLWATLVASTRFTGVLVIGPAIAIAALAPFFHGPDEQRLWRCVRTFVALGLAVLLGSGWFYGLNLWRYGDITGGATLLEALERPIRAPTYTLLNTKKTWVVLHDHLTVRLAGGVWLKQDYLIDATRAVTVFATVGFELAVFRVVWSAVRPRWPRGPQAWGGIGVVCTVMLLVWALVEFHHRGGTLSPRYGFPMLWGMGLLYAVGWGGFGRRIGLIWGLFLQLGVTLCALQLYSAKILRCKETDVTCVTERFPWLGPWVYGLVGLLVLAVAMVCWNIARSPAPESPHGEGLESGERSLATATLDARAERGFEK